MFTDVLIIAYLLTKRHSVSESQIYNVFSFIPVQNVSYSLKRLTKTQHLMVANKLDRWNNGGEKKYIISTGCYQRYFDRFIGFVAGSLFTIATKFVIVLLQSL